MTEIQGSIAAVASKPSSKFPEIIDVTVKITFSVDRSQSNVDELNAMMGRAANVRIELAETPF